MAKNPILILLLSYPVFFLEDMHQVDGMAKGGASFVAGRVFVKVYVFSFQQLRAQVAANSITVSFAQILQLLQFQHEKRLKGS
eukprot:1193793-Pleurochrysis_carterae.AAC.1